jgi:hypothetical protein
MVPLASSGNCPTLATYPPVEPKTHCSRCGTVILEATARRNQGRCAPCWARRPAKRIPEVLGGVLLAPLFFLAVPFILVREVFSDLRKRWQFPFKIAPLRKRLRSIFGNGRDVRLYLGGLIEGYHEPRVCPMIFDPANLARVDGLLDGTALKEGRIPFEELPSRGRPFAHDIPWSPPRSKGGRLLTKR